MQIPKDRKYTKEHEWIQPNGNSARIGITDYAQSQLGDVVFVELPRVGAVVRIGMALSIVESVKAVSDIYAPVNGVIVEVNNSLAEAPELINKDAYGQGWIGVLELENPLELSSLLTSEAYGKLLGQGGE